MSRSDMQTGPWRFKCGDVRVEVALTDDACGAHESLVSFGSFKQARRWNPKNFDGAILIAEAAVRLAVESNEAVADAAASGLRNNQYRVELCDGSAVGDCVDQEIQTALTRVRITDVPVKLLRDFSRAQGYGIPYLSTSTKDNLLVAILERDPKAEDSIQNYLATRTDYKIESLPGGRRITRFYADGAKRVYEEVVDR